MSLPAAGSRRAAHRLPLRRIKATQLPRGLRLRAPSFPAPEGRSGFNGSAAQSGCLCGSGRVGEGGKQAIAGLPLRYPRELSLAGAQQLRSAGGLSVCSSLGGQGLLSVQGAEGEGRWRPP